MFSVSTGKHPDDMRWLIGQLLHSYWGWWLDEKRIREGVDNSLCFWMHVYDGEIAVPVGFARVVTDKTMFSSIVDFFITEEHQRQGLGSELIRYVMRHPDVKNTVCVLATRDAAGFYSKFSFDPVTDPVLKRNPS